MPGVKSSIVLLFCPVALMTVSAGGATSGAESGRRELLKNCGFEEWRNGRCVDWNVPKVHFRLGENEGFNGARGLVFENADDTNFYGMVTQTFAAEPGKRYEMSVWVAKEHATSRVQIGIECWGKDGKWLGGTYQNDGGALDQAKTCDWFELKSISKPIPEGTERCGVNVAVGNSTRPGWGCIGKVAIDNVSVREYVPEVFGGLFSSAYRGQAADGKVTFRAVINVAGRRDSVSARFAYFAADGAKRIVDAPVLTDAAASLELDVKDLAMGSHPVGFELTDADGRRLGGAAIPFERLARLPERYSYLDGRGRLIVAGKPFFPLGLFCSLMPPASLEKVAASPFNAVMPYGRPDRDMLDRCESAGVKVVFSVDKYYHFLKSRPPEATDEKSADAAAVAKVNEFKDHPAIIAWYSNDEIAIDRMPILERRYELLKATDPGRPVWTLLCEMSHVHEYMRTFDVIGTDPYPVPLSDISMAADWTRATVAETYGVRPVWQVPQMFDWTRYDRRNARYPTKEEMINMSWQCLANGANGLIWYMFYGVYPKGVYDGEELFGWDKWLDCCATAATVEPFVPVFLSEDDEPAVSCSVKSASARAWSYRGSVFLAVVNNTRERISGEASLRGSFKVLERGFAQGEGEVRLAAPDRVAFSLDGLAVRVLRLR